MAVIRLHREPKNVVQEHGGYISLFRTIKDQPWYKHSEYKAVFIHLLLEAAYQPISIRFKGESINLLPGQLASSYEQLSRDLGINKINVRRAIAQFKKLGQISALKFKKYTVYTISKWSDFQQKSDTLSDIVSDTVKHQKKQGLEPKCDTPTDTATDTQNNNINNNKYTNVYLSCSEQSSKQRKKYTNIKLPLNRKDTFHRVSEDDYSEYCELYPAVDVTVEFRKMYAWLKANPRRKKTASGIGRFIHNWLSKAQDSAPSPQAAQQAHQTLQDKINDTSWADGLEV